MAHYPRSRDHQAGGQPPDDATPDAEPADGLTPADQSPNPEPAPPSDPGAIQGWSPTGPPGAGDPGPDTPDLQQPVAGWAEPANQWSSDPGSADTGGQAPSGSTAGEIPGWQDPSGQAAATTESRGGIGGLVRRFWILGVIAVVVLGGLLFRDRLSGSATDLQIGDCIELPSGGADVEEIESVQHQPCNEPHAAEVFLVYDIPAGTDGYPSETEFDASVQDRCFPAFNAYTGKDLLSQQELDVYWMYPMEEGWNRGDHEMVCLLYRLDGGTLTESMKAS